MAAIRAVSFDLWDTVFIDDSDEPKRKEQGLPPKQQERNNLVLSMASSYCDTSDEEVEAVYRAVNAAFRKVWYEHNVTWTVSERLRLVLDGIGCKMPDEPFARLQRLHEEMELRVKPELVPGVVEVLEKLAKKYKLVVISDAIFSPGWALRKLLEHYGLLDLFTGCVFSDEIGCSKPSPDVFLQAAELASCGFDNMVHIGDREAKDVAGPHAVGAKAILVTMAIDRDSKNTQANAICHDYQDLESMIQAL